MSLVRSFLACMALCAAAAAPAFAAARVPLPPDQVKVNDLVQDLQKTSQSPGTLDLVWWIPPEFWDAALASQSGMDEKSRREFGELFGKYTVVAAVKGEMGSFGVGEFESEEDIRAKLRIVDGTGKSHSPIPAEKVDRKLTMFIQVMQPMFKSLLGEIGDNLRFYAFPAKSSDRKRIADPLGDGTFRVLLGDVSYDFRLPLGSLLVPRIDPDTGEAFPGSYSFNPYTGAALQPASP